MIKNYLITLCILTSSWCSAQENKHKFVANAAIQFNGGGPVYFGGLNAGYFISDRIAIGLTGNFTKRETASSVTYPSYFLRTENSSVSNYSGIFAQYNYVPDNHKLGFFLNLNSSYVREKSRLTQTEINNGIEQVNKRFVTRKGFTIEFNPGIIYFFNHTFSMEATLANIEFNTFYSKNDFSELTGRSSRFDTRFFNSSVRLGFSYYFGCEKKDEKKITE